MTEYRIKPILGRVRDIEGRDWRVRERQSTRYGWEILRGTPVKNGKCGSTQVIPTRELIGYLKRVSSAEAAKSLPVSRFIVDKMRRQYGIGILETIKDYSGARWNVTDRRKTIYGFDILLGWPVDDNRAGGKQFIPTDDIVEFLKGSNNDRKYPDLPISQSAIYRLCKRLGLDNRYSAADKWWADRIDELKRLTSREFAERYGLHEPTVRRRQWELLRLSSSRRPVGWWRAPQIWEILDKPDDEAMNELGISKNYLRCLRYKTRGVCTVSGCNNRAVRGEQCEKHSKGQLISQKKEKGRTTRKQKNLAELSILKQSLVSKIRKGKNGE